MLGGWYCPQRGKEEGFESVLLLWGRTLVFGVLAVARAVTRGNAARNRGPPPMGGIVGGVVFLVVCIWGLEWLSGPSASFGFAVDRYWVIFLHQ